MGKYVLGRRGSNAVRWVEQNMLGRRAHQRRHGRPSRDTKFLEAGGRIGLAKSSSFPVAQAEDWGANYSPGTTIDGHYGTSTVYYVPYVTDRVFLYNGTAWKQQTFDSEDAQTDVEENKVHDVFAYYDTDAAAVRLEVVAWASDANRSTKLKRLNGVLVKDDSGSEDPELLYTRRYLGTVRKISGQQLCDFEEKRFVWNQDNRIPKQLAKNWSHTGSSTPTEVARLEWLSGASYPIVNVQSSLYAYHPVSTIATYEALLIKGGNALKIGTGVVEYGYAGTYYNASGPTVTLKTSGAHQICLRGRGYCAAILQGRNFSTTTAQATGVLSGIVWC